MGWICGLSGSCEGGVVLLGEVFGGSRQCALLTVDLIAHVV